MLIKIMKILLCWHKNVLQRSRCLLRYLETTKMLLCWTRNCVPVIDHESIFMLNIRMYCSHRSYNAGYKTVDHHIMSHWLWRLKMFLSWIRVYVLQPQIKLCWVQYCIAAIDHEDFTMLTTKYSGTAIDHGEIVIMSFDQDAQRSWDQDALIEAEIKIPYGAEIIIIVLVHHLKKILCWISVSQLRGDRAVATALCTGLIKAPQISSYGERVGKWCE